MAASSWGVNDALAVKLWSKKLFHEALKQTEMSKFMGEGSGSMIQVLNDTKKGAGDRITFGLRMQLSGTGVQGDGTLEGNEEALSTFSDNILINQLRHAVRSGGKMSEQRIPFSVREEARMGLQDWWADRIDQSLINALCGVSSQTDTRYTGNNTATAPTTGHVIYPATGELTEASITANVTSGFNLTLIDKAVATAKVTTPLIRPISNAQYDYVCFIHPNQTLTLRASTATAGSWGDLTRAMLQGGQSLDKNAFGNGALGIYNRTLIVENARIPLISVSGSAAGRRAVFCGAQSAVFAVGQDNSPEKMSWVEELFDYENQLGVSAGMIFGAKKCVFNSLDFGTITLPTYAPAP
jgi:N4-gp56 family major capsid protein